MSVVQMLKRELNLAEKMTESNELQENASVNKSRCFLELSGVSIDFPTRKGPFRALNNVNLKITKGEFVSIIGHSGCGKSTVMNIVAGLAQATEGGAILDGK